jgi:hypothetical protein
MTQRTLHRASARNSPKAKAGIEHLIPDEIRNETVDAQHTAGGPRTYENMHQISRGLRRLA